MEGLKGKNAVVTGSGSGIGNAIAKALAREKVNIVVCDISEEMAKTASEELASMGVRSAYYVVDVREVEKDKELVEKIEKEFGQIDILVNNAGVSFTGSVLEMTPQLWDLVNGINIRGSFFMSQAVFEKMLPRKKGRIINIASISGDRPADFSDAAYCCSKAGVLMMSRVYAKAARGTEITVNSVSPGTIDTPLTARLGTTVDPDKIPMARMGSAEEVADAVVFLASDMASYITGQNIRVNGGQFMY